MGLISLQRGPFCLCPHAAHTLVALTPSTAYTQVSSLLLKISTGRDSTASLAYPIQSFFHPQQVLPGVQLESPALTFKTGATCPVPAGHRE